MHWPLHHGALLHQPLTYVTSEELKGDRIMRFVVWFVFQTWNWESCNFLFAHCHFSSSQFHLFLYIYMYKHTNRYIIHGVKPPCHTSEELESQIFTVSLLKSFHLFLLRHVLHPPRTSSLNCSVNFPPNSFVSSLGNKLSFPTSTYGTQHNLTGA